MQSYTVVQPQNNPCLVPDTLPSLNHVNFIFLFPVITRFGFKGGQVKSVFLPM